MKLVLVGSVLLFGLALGNGPGLDAQEEVQDLCLHGGAGMQLTPGQERHFMQEAEAPPNVDFSLLAVTPQGDRHYFILTPPVRLPDLSDRLCGSDLLEEFVPGGLPLERFDFGP